MNEYPAPIFANLSGNAPAMYDMENLYNGSFEPSTVHLQDNKLFGRYMRYLIKKAIDAFEWTMPDAWSKDYFLYVLYSWGYMAVLDTWQYGLIAQFPALTGYNMQHQPTDVTIDNQWLHEVKRKIGYNCVLFKLMPDFRGVFDLIATYAEQLAVAHVSVLVSMQNSRVTKIFGVRDNKVAEDLKKVYDQAARGEPLVITKNKKTSLNEENMWESFNVKATDEYIVTDLLSDMRKIENAFDTWVGIPNTNYEKKERMSTQEVAANDADTFTFSGALLKRMQNYCEQVNTMFKGDYMHVDWNPYIRRQLSNGNTDSTGDNESPSGNMG